MFVLGRLSLVQSPGFHPLVLAHPPLIAPLFVPQSTYTVAAEAPVLTRYPLNVAPFVVTLETS